MRLTKAKRFLVGLAAGAIPLVTAVSCDPNGGFEFFRDDDDGYYADDCYFGCYDDPYYYYDDCYYDDCYYADAYYFKSQ